MATLRRRKNNWQAIIRLKNYPNIYKSLVRSWQKREEAEQELQEFKKKLQVEKLGEEIFNNQRTDN